MEVEERLACPFLKNKLDLHKRFAFSGRETSSTYILVSIFALLKKEKLASLMQKAAVCSF